MFSSELNALATAAESTEAQCLDPLEDGRSRIQLLEWMGGDLACVNDAKSSFERISTEMGEKEVKLINYLVQHNHTSPLRGTVFKFKVKAPIFVARQWWKHVIASSHVDEQLGWNEKSFRYVEIDDATDFYVPSAFRLQSKSNKQGSVGSLPEAENQSAQALYDAAIATSFDVYQQLLDLGVCREQARGVLPPCVYTSWVWTASLQAVLHFIDLRQGHGAQSEIVAYANAVTELITPIVPETMMAWKIAGSL